MFGDYDVDGVTTAATLTSALRAFGGKVVPRAASRHAGYGLGVEDVARFAADGCKVLVTGDCGTSDHEALRGRARARARRHRHRPPRAADRRIGGLRAGQLAPRRRHVRRSRGWPRAAWPSTWRRRCARASARRSIRASCSISVALGTIADLVPLTDENRILVAAGLKVLSARKRPGLAALVERAELTDGPISAHQAAFRLTPRLNAAGRLGEAQLALDLLLASPADAPRLAEAINDQNTERQRIQELVWMEARAQGAAQADAPAVVVGAEGWHQGVVGIVAARLVDEFARPAIAIGFKDGEGRGSARTVAGVNLFEALAACGAHLTKFGGHAGGRRDEPGDRSAGRRSAPPSSPRRPAS